MEFLFDKIFVNFQYVRYSTACTLELNKSGYKPAWTDKTIKKV